MREITQDTKELLKGRSITLFGWNILAQLPTNICVVFAYILILSLNVAATIAGVALLIPAMLFYVQSTGSTIYTVMYLNDVGKLPTIGDMYKKGFEGFGRKFLLVLILSIITGIAGVINSIASIVVALMFSMSYFMMMDEEFEDYKSYELIGMSIELVSNNIKDVLKLYILNFLRVLGTIFIIMGLAMTVVGLIFLPFISIKLVYHIQVSNYKLYSKIK